MKYYRWRMRYIEYSFWEQSGSLELVADKIQANYIKNWKEVVTAEQLDAILWFIKEKYHARNRITRIGMFEPPKNHYEEEVRDMLRKLQNL